MMEFQFVLDLRLMCLKKVARMADEYGFKTTVLDSALAKKEARWPLTALSQDDLEIISEQLSTSLSLKNALVYKPTSAYWHSRLIKDYPSPHAIIPFFPRRKTESPTTRRAEGKDSKKKVAKPTVELPPINFLPHNSEWHRSFVEVAVAKRLQTASLEDLKEVQMLPLTLIKNLDLRNIKCRESGSSRTPEFPEILGSFPNLKRLSVTFRPLKNFLVSPVSSSIAEKMSTHFAKLSLTDFSLYESCLGDASAVPLIKSLSKMTSLKRLDLRHNRLTSTSIAALKGAAAALDLETLRLDHNNIDMSGSQDIAHLISASQSLRSLNLDLNPLGNEGSINILKSVLEHKCLKLLSMAGCKIEGSDCFWNLLLKLKETSSLHFLCLASNHFQQEVPQTILKLDKETKTRILITSSIHSLQLLLPEKRFKMQDPFQNLHSIIRTPEDDKPVLKYPTLPQEIIHGIDFDENTFNLEWEIQGACLYNKLLTS